MRQYKTITKEVVELDSIICNQCGKKIVIKDSIFQEGVASMEVNWGYCSRKDTEKHRVDICEDCYDKWVAGFKVPVVIEEVKEVF